MKFQPLSEETRKSILGAASRLVKGEIGAVEAARQLSPSFSLVDCADHELLALLDDFVGIDANTDDLPIGLNPAL